ncbi:MAG: RNA polymerase ECF-type sigma factor [Cytophagales bacterium]|jgi:RNA polymerase sigma-70 factor (ECF subfamily)|nr:sigma-70 family RNA polymerase sigma factor [Bacteroidota bacterium]MBS1981840.1 sigma-70 family RNA polymerase sigma factor [Bacteroidota bacterium]WHZ07460.1 MAG: RNA polymerase ECF-type sigma factor [Cytophagales bacterium]
MIDPKCSDSQLVSLYQSGNEEAFELLLRRHKSRIYTSIYLIVKDRYVAEDLLQDVFIKAVNVIKSGRYNEEGKFLPWISRIAHNLSIDHFRSCKRHPEVVLEDGSRLFDSLQFADENFEIIQSRQDTKSKLRALIKQLPQEQKEVLIMRQYLQMSFQEIADRTGVSINTALGRMRYALINLRKNMTKANAYDKNVYPTRSDEEVVPRNLSRGDEGD